MRNRNLLNRKLDSLDHTLITLKRIVNTQESIESYKVNINKVIGDTSTLIKKIVFDSRKVKSKDLYVAINGVKVDGHDYIDSAIKKGAICIVCESVPNKIQDGVLYVEVRYSPILHTKKGMTSSESIDAVKKGLDQAESDFGIKTGIFIVTAILAAIEV